MEFKGSEVQPALYLKAHVGEGPAMQSNWHREHGVDSLNKRFVIKDDLSPAQNLEPTAPRSFGVSDDIKYPSNNYWPLTVGQTARPATAVLGL